MQTLQGAERRSLQSAEEKNLPCVCSLGANAAERRALDRSCHVNAFLLSSTQLSRSYPFPRGPLLAPSIGTIRYCWTWDDATRCKLRHELFLCSRVKMSFLMRIFMFLRKDQALIYSQ